VNTGEQVSRGHEELFSFCSELTDCALVFEDDGECGYLYVMDAEQKIEEAVLLYRIESNEPTRSEVLDVAWSADGRVASVRLGAELIAIFNYRSKQFFSASGFPAPRKWVSVSRAEAEVAFLGQ
jgi:hypothetical protein